MKKLLTMMALGLLMTGGAYAQDTVKKENKQRTEQRTKRVDKIQKLTPEQRAEKQTEMMAKRLELSDAQKQQMQAINMRRVADMQALQDKYGKEDARNEAQRAERKAIQDKYHAEMKQVLNEKQYAQFEADRKQKRTHVRQMSKEKKVIRKVNKEKHQKQNG